MVRMLSPYFVLTALVASACAAAIKRSAVAQVQTDIQTINNQVTALDNSVNNFPATGGTILQLLAIHSAVGILATTLQFATTDVKAVSPSLISEADGQAVLAAVQALVPPILDGLSVVATKKSALENFPLIPVGSMILGDLQSLDSATSDFENALIAAAPADLKPQGVALQKEVDSAFAAVIAAYS